MKQKPKTNKQKQVIDQEKMLPMDMFDKRQLSKLYKGFQDSALRKQYNVKDVPKILILTKQDSEMVNEHMGRDFILMSLGKCKFK